MISLSKEVSQALVWKQGTYLLATWKALVVPLWSKSWQRHATIIASTYEEHIW